MLVFGYRQVYGPNGLVTRLLTSVFPGLDTGWFSGFFAVAVVMTFASTGNHLLFLSSALAASICRPSRRPACSVLRTWRFCARSCCRC